MIGIGYMKIIRKSQKVLLKKIKLMLIWKRAKRTFKFEQVVVQQIQISWDVF